MRRTTPVWVRLVIVALLVAGPGYWLAQRNDRIANERRLSAVATAIAGRDVRVRCPGIVGRVFSWDTVEGTVRFGADGRPADETRLRAFTGTELDALAEGRRGAALACAERRGTACGPPAENVALAVDVLVHEAWHLAGILDEAVAECRAVQSLAWGAERLGATPAQGRALARAYLTTGYPRLPDAYRTGKCADGAALDMRPDDAAWP